MTVRLDPRIRLEALGLHCWACGASALVEARHADDQEPPVNVWARAHRDPRLVHLFASVDEQPVEMHRVRRPTLLR